MRQNLLGEDHPGDYRHPKHAHHAERKQNNHQAETAADAIEAVRETNPERSEPSPVRTDVVERATAVAEEALLRRCQLVDPCCRDRAARYIRATPVPVEPTGVERGHQPEEAVGGEAVRSPDREVPGGED